MNLRNLLRALDITVVNTLLSIAFIGGLLLTVWEINIYHKTFIPTAIPLIIWVFIGLITTILLRDFLKTHYKTDNIFCQLIYNLGAWGGISVYAFMAFNFFIASADATNVSQSITTRGHFAKGKSGCGEPYAYIVYNDQEKQIVFPCDTKIETAKNVRLTIRKGLWGYEVITAQELVY